MSPFFCRHASQVELVDKQFLTCIFYYDDGAMVYHELLRNSSMGECTSHALSVIFNMTYTPTYPNIYWLWSSVLHQQTLLRHYIQCMKHKSLLIAPRESKQRVKIRLVKSGSKFFIIYYTIIFYISPNHRVINFIRSTRFT